MKLNEEQKKAFIERAKNDAAKRKEESERLDKKAEELIASPFFKDIVLEMGKVQSVYTIISKYEDILNSSIFRRAFELFDKKDLSVRIINEDFDCFYFKIFGVTFSISDFIYVMKNNNIDSEIYMINEIYNIYDLLEKNKDNKEFLNVLTPIERFFISKELNKMKGFYFHECDGNYTRNYTFLSTKESYCQSFDFTSYETFEQCQLWKLKLIQANIIKQD